MSILFHPICHNSIIQLVETFRVIQEVAISGNRKWQKSQLFSRAGAPDVDTADATSRLTTATPGCGEDCSAESVEWRGGGKRWQRSFRRTGATPGDRLRQLVERRKAPSERVLEDSRDRYWDATCRPFTTTIGGKRHSSILDDSIERYPKTVG